MPVNSLGTNGGAAQATAELGVERGDRIGLFPPPDDGGHALENLLTFLVIEDPRGGGEPAQRALRFTFRQVFYEVTDVTHAGWMTKLHATRKHSGNRGDDVPGGWTPYGQRETPMRRLTAHCLVALGSSRRYNPAAEARQIVWCRAVSLRQGDP